MNKFISPGYLLDITHVIYVYLYLLGYNLYSLQKTILNYINNNSKMMSFFYIIENPMNRLYD